MKTQTVVSGALAGLLVLGLMPSTAVACGESLFRVGQGVRYRQYSAPLPATVLIYAEAESDHAMAERLQEAGHTVQVVHTAAELASRIEAGDLDVVIAPIAQAQVAARPSGHRFLPVVLKGSLEERASRDYELVLTEGDSVKTYLKTIHQSLQDRES